MSIPVQYLVEHYPSRAEKIADGWVHGVGLLGATVGGAALIGPSLAGHGGGLTLATGLYALCLITMLACSAAYNLTQVSPVRPWLHRLDEAGIFLMIAGSYTPFTTQRLTGGWAVGMTALVWSAALTGVAGKLVLRRAPEWLWTLVYVAFGWIAVIALGPLVTGVSAAALMLLVIGGLIYTSGVLVFHSRAPFRRAIWHGFVVAAAGVHYAAIFVGVVLAAKG